MIRRFWVWIDEVRRSIEWLIKRLIKAGAKFLTSVEVIWPRRLSLSPGSPLLGGIGLGFVGGPLALNLI